VTVSPIAGLNALNVLQPNRVLVTKAALDALRSRAPKKSEADKSEAAT
jgi:hypothetical protein